MTRGQTRERTGYIPRRGGGEYVTSGIVGYYIQYDIDLVVIDLALMGAGPELDGDRAADAAMPIHTHVAQFVTQAHARQGARRPRRDSVIAWSDAFGRVVSAGAGRGEGGGYRFVAFLTSPSMVCLESMLGCLGAGCVVVPVNVRWSLDEMVSALGGLGVVAVVAVVADVGFAAGGQALCARLGSLSSASRKTSRLVVLDPLGCQTPGPTAPGVSGGRRTLRKAPHDVAFVIFTSGTSSPQTQSGNADA